MSYPIEKSLVSAHAAEVWRRARLLLLLGGLLCGVLSGLAVYKLMPALYKLNGIILLNHFAGKTDRLPEKNIAETLEKSFHREFIRFALAEKCSPEDGTFKTSSQAVADSVVLNWSAEFANERIAERFRQYQESNIAPRIKQLFSTAGSGFSVDRRPVKQRDLRKSIFFAAAGAACGFLLWVLAGMTAGVCYVSCDHSVGDLGEFEKKYSLGILGVLPQVGCRRNIELKKLSGDPHFQRAVNSLLLEMLLFKRSANRALVLVISSLQSRNGSSSVAVNLAGMLRSYDFRVLLLGKDDLKTDSLPLAVSMEELLAREAGVWDFIIIDVPDSRSSSTPMIIGRLADFMLLVCDYRKCPGYLLELVLWRLRKANVKVAGCVINHFPIHKRRADLDAYQHFFYRCNPQQGNHS